MMITNDFNQPINERFPSDLSGRRLTLVATSYQHPAVSFDGGLVYSH